jgi:hypothetical protein
MSGASRGGFGSAAMVTRSRKWRATILAASSGDDSWRMPPVIGLKQIARAVKDKSGRTTNK